jgi:hypothetical protein
MTLEDAATGGLGEDVLYGIENLQFGTLSNGGYDWDKRFKLEAETNDWDGDGKIDDFRGTMFGDVFIDDDSENANSWIDTGAGNDIIVAGGGGDSISSGSGNDYINGQSNVSQFTTDGYADEWGSRDEAVFWDTAFNQVEVTEVSVFVNNVTGLAQENSGQWLVYGYTGDAALTSDAVEIKTDATPATINGYTQSKAFLVTDTKSGGIGTNLLVGIESIGFQDQYLEMQGRTNEWSWTDWMTGETITEKSVEGTLFSELLTGGNGTDSLSGKGGDDILRGYEGGDRLRGGTGNDVLDGGADGTSGDAWRDSDTVEYNGIEARYTIYQVKVAANLGEATASDTSSLSSAGNVVIYDTLGVLPVGA